jgi:hypothetical protein
MRFHSRKSRIRVQQWRCVKHLGRLEVNGLRGICRLGTRIKRIPFQNEPRNKCRAPPISFPRATYDCKRWPTGLPLMHRPTDDDP